MDAIVDSEKIKNKYVAPFKVDVNISDLQLADVKPGDEIHLNAHQELVIGSNPNFFTSSTYIIDKIDKWPINQQFIGRQSFTLVDSC